MKIIGLTGGIGSGKSTVTDYLRQKGYEVLDADEIAREIVRPGSEVLLQLTEIFGDQILLGDGNLNRKALGRQVFADEEKRMRLNRVMHAKIVEVILDRIFLFQESADALKKMHWEMPQSKAIFIDAPLLFETGLHQHVGEVWMVDADDEVRITRVMERDGLGREEIERRMAAQMDREEKKRKAHVILDNTGEKEVLYRQIEALLAVEE